MSDDKSKALTPEEVLAWADRWDRKLKPQQAAADAPQSQPVGGIRRPSFSVPKVQPKRDEPEPSPEPEPVEPEIEPEPVEEVIEPLKEAAPGTAVAVLPPVPVVGPKDLMEAMNEQHAIIENVGGKTVIACWEPNPLHKGRRMVVFHGKESFLLRYSNRKIAFEASDGMGNTKPATMPLANWWLSHRDRRQHRGIVFLPNGEPIENECLNLWQGWGVTPAPGDWSLIRDHIRSVLADGDEEYADYLERWIAWSIQNPAAQAEVALVLIGAKGAGKGTLVRCLERIFGAHTFQVTSREEVIGKFNGHLQDCVLFVADEAYWGGDKRCVGRLQGMITETTIPIERKGIDLVQVPNYLHVVMLAEPGWVIPAGRYERRYAAFAVSIRHRGDHTYFKALHRQIAGGGAEAMMWDLERMDLDGWHPREIPESLLRSAAMQKQQGFTLPPMEQWYVMLLHTGVIPNAIPGRPNTAYTKDLMEDAKAAVPRLRWDLSDVSLRNFLTESEESIGIQCSKYRSSFGNGWAFPTLRECRAAWEIRYGATEWDRGLRDGEDWGIKWKPKPENILDRRVGDETELEDGRDANEQ